MKSQYYYDNLKRNEIPTKTDRKFMLASVVALFIGICAWMGVLV
ncbi:hypothetical protein [Vibrio casei]